MEEARKGNLTGKEVNERLAEMEAQLAQFRATSAVKIIVLQCFARCTLARWRASELRTARDAAIKLQSEFRAQKARKYCIVVRAVAEAAKEAERHVAQLRVRRAYATFRERKMRAYAVSAIVNTLREAERHASAYRIQDAFREAQLRRSLGNTRLYEEDRREDDDY